MAVERGSLEQVVAATGTLTPVTTVEVGTQASGQIAELFVDSIVSSRQRLSNFSNMSRFNSRLSGTFSITSVASRAASAASWVSRTRPSIRSFSRASHCLFRAS